VSLWSRSLASSDGIGLHLKEMPGQDRGQLHILEVLWSILDPTPLGKRKKTLDDETSEYRPQKMTAIEGGSIPKRFLSSKGATTEESILFS